MSTPTHSFKQSLCALLLTLLVWSALFPAHTGGQRAFGRWIELCTDKGMTSMWVDDSAAHDSTSHLSHVKASNDAFTVDNLNNPPPHTEHSEPHCAWCLFSLPTLTLLTLLGWFIIPRLRHVFNSASTHLTIQKRTLWLQNAPRAPPLALHFV